MSIELIFLLLILLLLLTRIQKVSVVGNSRYTEEQVTKMIFTGYRWADNSFYMYVKERLHRQRTIPFVESYQIRWINPISVEVTLYEKKLVGYVDYMNHEMYFDKDGIVQESSAVKLPDVPRIVGLQFDSIQIMEKLPVQNDTVFQDILNLTGALEQYQIPCEYIEYDSLMHATLHLKQIQVKLGNNENMEMKISTLNDILPKLSGRSGILDLSSYTRNKERESYVFRGS